MHQALFFLPLLASLAIAQDECAGPPNLNLCTPLTYNDVTTSHASPPTSTDCQQTCGAVSAEAGNWGFGFSEVPADGRKTMMLYACAFSVGRGDGEPADAYVEIHNQDINDVIGNATAKFADRHGGSFAAEGTMACGEEGYVVKWYID